MKKHQQAFTLIELLVAVTIASILLAVGVPQYLQYVARSQAAEGMSLAQGLQDEIQDAYSFDQTIPTALTDITQNVSTDFSGRYTESVDIGPGGEIIVTFGGDSGAAINGQQLVLYAYTNGANDLFYFCEGAAIPVNLTQAVGQTATTSIPTSARPQDCR